MGVETLRHCRVGDVEGVFHGGAVDGRLGAVEDVETGEGVGPL